MLNLFQNLPPELSTFLLSIIPITEIRVSIPVALEVYNLSIVSAFFWSVLGNALTSALILWLVGPLYRVLSKLHILNRFFDWLFERTRQKFYQKHQKYGDIALVLFVAVPLPGTGCWTGSLVAWLFGIPFKKSFTLVTIGILISAVIVTLISVGVSGLIKLI